MAHIPDTINTKLIAERLDALHKRYERFPKLGEGSYRVTYDLGNGMVAKVPSKHSLFCFDNTGMSANFVEHAIYKKYSRSKIFAKCRMIWKFGIPILIMEKVNREAPSDDYNARIQKKQLSFYDGLWQCGKNSKGNVVCYDYGNEFDFLDHAEYNDIKVQYMDLYKKLSLTNT